VIIAYAQMHFVSYYPSTTLAEEDTRATDFTAAWRACIRKSANIDRQTLYATRTPAASAARTAHTSINKSATAFPLNFILAFLFATGPCP
jgi:hypothetical protein